MSIVIGLRVGTPVMAAERSQWWAVKLFGSSYFVECCGSEHNEAGVLFRCSAETNDQLERTEIAIV